MRYVMYTEKSVPQAMSAINERLHTPGSKSRPQLDGWVEKSGRFSMHVNSNVKWRLMRKTVLQGKAEKLGNITLIQGTVPGGVGTQGMLVIFAALAAVAVIVYTQGNAILAAAAILAGIGLYVPLVGDFQNCETLLSELQKAVNAKFTPPNGKPTATASASTVTRTPTTATRTTTTAKAVNKSASTARPKSPAKPTTKSTMTTRTTKSTTGKTPAKTA